MANQQPTEVVASAARTADANSGSIPIAVVDWARTNGPRPQTQVVLALDVTAQSGTTPTLDVALEWSLDGGASFAAPVSAPAFAQIGAATGLFIDTFPVLGDAYRIVWVLGGTDTPTYTFSIREFVQ